MKKALRIAGAVAAVILIIVAGISFFVKSYLTDARIRALVTESAESALRRKVSLGAVSVSIFRGISIDNFEIKEKGSDADFLKAGSFKLRYQLLPLLSRRLIIDEMAIESPRIVIKKNSDGSLNFSDILQAKGQEENKTREQGGLPVTLSVSSLRIKSARIEYDDAQGKISKALVGLDADVSLHGLSKEVIGSSGKAKVVFLELSLKGRPAPVRDIPVSAEYRLELKFRDKTLTVEEAKVNAAGIPAHLKGTINYGTPLSYSLEVNAESVNLSEVRKTAESLLPPGVGLEGVLSMHMTVQQKPAQDARPIFSGEARLDKVGISTEKIRPVFSGVVTFAADEIGLRDMKLVAGSSTADISGRIAHYRENPDIRIDLRSPMLDLDRIMPPPAGMGGAGSSSGAARNGGEEERESGPLKTKITAEGEVDIEKMLFKGINIVNLKAHYIYRNDVLTLSPVSGGTLSGSFSARSTLDLSKKGTTYALHSETDGIRLEEITAAFAPRAKGTLFGSLSSRADINGAGTAAAAIKQNLRGKGIFSIRDGKISNARISEGLLALLGLQSLKEIPIQKAGGTFAVSGGVIDLRSIISSRDLALNETGTIGMDQKLDMKILVKVSDRLSPELISRSGLTQFLSEEEGWTAVPLKLGGTIAGPSYGVDTQAIGKAATRTIQKRVEQEIFKALSGEKEKKKTTGKQQSETQQKTGASPEDLLKQLFK